MRSVGKITVALFLLLSAIFYTHCANVLRTKDLDESNNPLSSIDGMVFKAMVEADARMSTTTVGTTVIPSTTRYCNCGEYSKSCQYNWDGDKICDCYPGYVENYGNCEECNCGPYGSCSFQYGRKRCNCSPFADEINGVCVDKGTSSEGTTVSITTSGIETTTVNDCDCGQFGRCTFRNGRKRCICKPFTDELYGKCEECRCGLNTISCKFDWNYNKVCTCTSGYAQNAGICEDCKCGENSQSCIFKDNDVKVCDCNYGYIQINGSCAAICNEDKCIHGTCEVAGNYFKCRCNKGFTGLRCEEKIEPKSKNQDIWMLLLLSVVFAIFILLSAMFCFWTRILNKMSKK